MCFVEQKYKWKWNGIKMENPTHSFRERNLVLQLIKKSQIKSKTVMNWSLRKKKEDIFCTVYFVRRNLFFKHLCFISMYSILNTLSEFKYFYISKILLHTLLLLVLKIVESAHCIFKMIGRSILWAFLEMTVWWQFFRKEPSTFNQIQ